MSYNPLMTLEEEFVSVEAHQSEAAPVNSKIVLAEESLIGSLLEVGRAWVMVPERLHFLLQLQQGRREGH